MNSVKNFFVGNKEEKEKKMFYADLGYMFLFGLFFSIILYYDREVLLSDFGGAIVISFFGLLVFFINNKSEYKIKLKHIILYPIGYSLGAYLGKALSIEPHNLLFGNDYNIISYVILFTGLLIFIYLVYLSLSDKNK